MLRTATLFGLLATCAAAESPAAPDPVFVGTAFLAFDLASVKEGQWVRYEIRVDAPGAPMPNSGYTIACVGADEKSVMIETDQFSPGAQGYVTLARVDRASGRTIEAWFGKRGEVGRSLKITSAPAPAATGKKPDVEMTGEASVKQDSLRVKSAPFGCERITYAMTMKLNGQEYRSVTKTWTSTDVYFRYRIMGGDSTPNVKLQLEWENDKKPDGKGGLVRMESEMNGLKTVMELAGWGDNAGRSLRLPDDPADFVPAGAPHEANDDAKPEEKPAPKETHE